MHNYYCESAASQEIVKRCSSLVVLALTQRYVSVKIVTVTFIT